MRLTVERAEFADLISWAARSIPPKVNIPTLSGALLRAESDLTVSAFDYEVAVKGSTPAQVDEPGVVLVGARMLAEIVRNLPAEPITLATEDNRLALSCGKARFLFPLLPVEDYPDLPEFPQVVGRVESIAFADAVSRVSFAADPNKATHALRGVIVESSGDELVLAGTDGFRISARWMDWRPEGESAKTLPHVRHLSEAAKSISGLGELRVGINESMFGVATARRTVIMRSIADAPAQFRRLILPVEMSIEFSIPELVSALKLISPTVDDVQPVVLSYDVGAVTLSGGKETAGSIEVPCDYDGAPFIAGYRPRFLLDALGAIEGDTAIFGYPSEDAEACAKKPVRINGKDARHEQVLMPVRLS